jgi:ABC-type antimicrobial peptide transport system permease subunit
MTMDDRVTLSLSRPRTYAVLLSIFALFALTVAGVGLFGVLSYSVALRSREIGVRSALGAGRRQIVGLVLKQAIAVGGAGVAVGIAASLALTRYLAAFLYGIGPYDAASFVAVGVVLLAVSALSCIVPARRAARVDPMVVLRGS